MNTYTDPKLLDVYGALDTLPTLDLDATPSAERQTMRATGTDDPIPDFNFAGQLLAGTAGAGERQAKIPSGDDAAGGGQGEVGGKPAKELQRCQRLAYFASLYAELKLERKLYAYEVYEYWEEYGFDSADKDTENAAELAEYQLPDSFSTFETQLSNGRRGYNDRGNESRKGRKGRSIVGEDEI